MFTHKMFEVTRVQDVGAGDLVQREGEWLLSVEGGKFLPLSGDYKSSLKTIETGYVLTIRKQGLIDIVFEDALDMSAIVPGKFGMIAFTDNGVRLVARTGGSYEIYSLDGSRVEEQVRMQATIFGVTITTPSGKTIQVI